ncbi:NADP-dependent isocitrate dehydrogenase [Ferrimicrobium sp.]|uniref:NADP-dependent isocitrate dehydrogenase n=1 Tax=Ferrimicrobium sp. TaxID=2926050 RepID=UPI00262020DC|nr:NADP-dependent isocitrate dehydrogenase [Ferrimicrobium sp.]
MSTTDTRRRITVAEGDGIGPEIMAATLAILDAAGAKLEIERIKVGAQVFEQGISSGVEQGAWDSLRRTKVLLKAPITTPQGGGFKSVNVTIRKTLGLYANIRPCISYAPFVPTLHPGMNLVIIRENEEDLYGGIEHRQTQDVFQTLKLITRPGSERIIRYAFEYARRYHRHKVTSFTKDNIMKLSDGTFHKIFDEVAAEYPDIEAEHWIIDIGTAKLATAPEQFDVLVLPNLYGDILSDVAAEITGSVGLAGSANIGDQIAMFEAIHGSAPPLAGRDLANPSGLLMGAVLMLVHLGLGEIATTVHNAWLRTIEDGVHTQDIFSPVRSNRQVGTAAFAEAVIERLGLAPKELSRVHYPDSEEPISVRAHERPLEVKTIQGIDIFLEWRGDADELGHRIEANLNPKLTLVMISNRGQKVYPDGAAETFCVDHWRCRFQAKTATTDITTTDLIDQLVRLNEAGLPFIKTEGLFAFDGVPGYSLSQGQ